MKDMKILNQLADVENSKISVSPVAFKPQSTPAIISPLSPTTVQFFDDGVTPRLITVFLHPDGDPERDRRRIKNIYGILISHHGKDRFQFQVFENGRGHLIDFPNDTTHVGPEMLTRLKKLMGEELWRVEEIADHL